MKTNQNTMTKGFFIISLLSVSLTGISMEIEKAETFRTQLKGNVLKLVKDLRKKEKSAEQKKPAKSKIIKFKTIMKISKQDVKDIAPNLDRNTLRDATTSINTFITLARRRNTQSRAIDNLIEKTEISTIRNKLITRLKKRRVTTDKEIVKKAQEIDTLFKNSNWYELIYNMEVSKREYLK